MSKMTELMDKVFEPDLRVMLNSNGIVIGIWPLTQAGAERIAKEKTTYDELLPMLSGLTVESVEQ